MKQLISAGVIVYRLAEHGIEYLLLHYPAGHWDFAKGKMEPGETKQETALRELQEEAGITANLLPNFVHSFEYIFHDYDGTLAKKTVYFFIGKAESEVIRLSYEHDNFAWLPYKKAREEVTFDNAKTLLKKAHAVITKAEHCTEEIDIDTVIEH